MLSIASFLLMLHLSPHDQATHYFGKVRIYRSYYILLPKAKSHKKTIEIFLRQFVCFPFSSILKAQQHSELIINFIFLRLENRYVFWALLNPFPYQEFSSFLASNDHRVTSVDLF